MNTDGQDLPTDPTDEDTGAEDPIPGDGDTGDATPPATWDPLEDPLPDGPAATSDGPAAAVPPPVVSDAAAAWSTPPSDWSTPPSDWSTPHDPTRVVRVGRGVRVGPVVAVVVVLVALVGTLMLLGDPSSEQVTTTVPDPSPTAPVADPEPAGGPVGPLPTPLPITEGPRAVPSRTVRLQRCRDQVHASWTLVLDGADGPAGAAQDALDDLVGRYGSTSAEVRAFLLTQQDLARHPGPSAADTDLQTHLSNIVGERCSQAVS